MQIRQGLPYDRELEAAFPRIREAMSEIMRPRTAEEIVGDRAIDVSERTVPGPPGAPDITLAIFQPRIGVTNAPIMYYIHGGGMIGGDRCTVPSKHVEWVEQLAIVLVSVEYRLAPQHPHPALVEDCYAGLRWTYEHADEIGGDSTRIVIGGGSAGGGLSAATALLARDRGGPPLLAQYLQCPMMDDRSETVSMQQFDGLDGVFTRSANVAAWTAVLGEASGGPDVSPYAAPARATDLSGLPQAFIDAGSSEPFRDEAVDYATRLWAAGVQAELHIWAGGFHGFTALPTTQVAQAAEAAQLNWLTRVFSPPA
jgi:acetyl esterase/lipase